MRVALVINETVIFQFALSLFDSTGRAERDDEEFLSVQGSVSGPVPSRVPFGFVMPDDDGPDPDDGDDRGNDRRR